MTPADRISKSARGSPARRNRPQHRRPQVTAAQTSADVPPNIPNIADEAALIEERLHGAWADLKDVLDGRHGYGARARKVERDAAEVIGSACGRLRVLVHYLRDGVAGGAP